MNGRLTGIANGMVPLILAMVLGGTGLVPQARAEGASANDGTPRGKMLYDRHCAGCHGTQGKGDGYKLLGADPANLTSPSTQRKSDSVLLTTIHEGKPNMPSWKVLLSEQDSRDVLAYVRTLAK